MTQHRKPLNEIEGGNMIIEMLRIGDIEGAIDYYETYCWSMRWTPMLAMRIRVAATNAKADPARFGSHEGSKQISTVRRGSHSVGD